MLSTRRILVVEDEFLIATELVDLLNDAGATIEGPFASVGSALAAIEDSEGGIDAAVLDVNLGEGGKSYLIADRLETLGIPYVFTNRLRAACRQPRLQRPPETGKAGSRPDADQYDRGPLRLEMGGEKARGFAPGPH